jgi:hypothetical protein
MEKFEEIKNALDKYDKNVTATCSNITRRGLCGQINISTVFFNLKEDLGLVEINLERTRQDLPNQIIDIYKLGDSTYIKRLCICDNICGDNKCTQYKDRSHCDGHHVIIVSPRKDTEIDVNNDYVIDFTYKQMLVSLSEEDIKENKIKLASLPNYLFIKLNDYIHYSSSHRWIENITKPCKNIVNNYKQKYIKYKQKYLELKNQSGGNIQTELDKCALKRYEKYAQDIAELIINRKDATRELSMIQEQTRNTDNFKIFNENDEKNIFKLSPYKSDYKNNSSNEPDRRPDLNLKNLNIIYENYADKEIVKMGKTENTKLEVGLYALMSYGNEKKKLIPYIGSYCYAPTVGIIEMKEDMVINNWEKVEIGNIARIWGSLEKSGKIGHVILEITTNNNMNISLGVGYYGGGDESKFDKLRNSTYGIIRFLENAFHRKNAVIYSPDYILNMKLYYQYNYPNRKYLKLLSQSILTREEHEKFTDLCKKINPKKNLAHISLNESEYDFTKRYNLSGEEYDMLTDPFLIEFYGDETYRSQLQQNKDEKNIAILQELNRYGISKEKNDMIDKLSNILKIRGKIIEQYWEKYLEDINSNENIIEYDYPYTKIFTYYLSYYWTLGDVDYCTITGYLPDRYSKSHSLKPVINCTKFATDLFPNIIDCKRTVSGIIDPESCKTGIKIKENNVKCDVEDVPNEYISYINIPKK